MKFEEKKKWKIKINYIYDVIKLKKIINVNKKKEKLKKILDTMWYRF